MISVFIENGPIFGLFNDHRHLFTGGEIVRVSGTTIGMILITAIICTAVSSLIGNLYGNNTGYNAGYNAGYDKAKEIYAPKVLPNAPMYLIEPGNWVSLHGYNITYLGKDIERADYNSFSRIHIGLLTDNGIAPITYYEPIGEIIKIAELRVRIISADMDALTFEDVTPP